MKTVIERLPVSILLGVLMSAMNYAPVCYGLTCYLEGYEKGLSFESLESAEAAVAVLIRDAKSASEEDAARLARKGLLIERDFILPLKQRSRSDNQDLANLLFSSRRWLSSARPALLLYFNEEVLTPLEDEISSDLILERGHALPLLLYCAIPGMTADAALKAVVAYETVCISGDMEQTKFCGNIVRTRFGDSLAWKHALVYLEELNYADRCHLELVQICTAYVHDLACIRDMAMRLDSMALIRYGEFWLPKRSIYVFGVIESRSLDLWYTMPPVLRFPDHDSKVLKDVIQWCDRNLEGFSSNGMNPIKAFSAGMSFTAGDGVRHVSQGAFYEPMSNMEE